MRWDDPSDAALSPTPNFFSELRPESISPNLNGIEFQGGIGSGSVNPSAISNGVEDSSAVFRDEAITEEPLFQTSEISPAENLYSTPLSWSEPTQSTYTNNAVLSAEQEARLRTIAMPQQSRQSRSFSSPDSESSPEPQETSRRKRKSSVEDEDDEDDEDSNGRHPVKKTAHNMIEKRYRTNLNDKIAMLRDSVPSLRVMSKKNHGEDETEDLQGLTPAHKLNKATVLSKATEYIAHLEKRNKVLTKENQALKARVDAFEMLVMARQNPNVRKPQRQSAYGMMG